MSMGWGKSGLTDKLMLGAVLAPLLGACSGEQAPASGVGDVAGTATEMAGVR